MQTRMKSFLKGKRGKEFFSLCETVTLLSLYLGSGLWKATRGAFLTSFATLPSPPRLFPKGNMTFSQKTYSFSVRSKRCWVPFCKKSIRCHIQWRLFSRESFLACSQDASCRMLDMFVFFFSSSSRKETFFSYSVLVVVVVAGAGAGVVAKPGRFRNLFHFLSNGGETWRRRQLGRKAAKEANLGHLRGDSLTGTMASKFTQPLGRNRVRGCV